MAEGSFAGKVHVLPVRIYFEDTDFSGVVYHANYLRYMERGRSEFFRSAGVESRSYLEGADPMSWTLRRIALDYIKPARLDDLLSVHSWLTGLSGARILVRQKIYRDQTLLVDGRVEACLMSLKGGPRRLPEQVRTTLTPYVAETET